MNVKIEPRNTADRGGYLMMPLRENVPVPSDGAWQLTDCPRCGRKCWSRPLPEGFTMQMFSGRLCTMCALKAGISG